MTEFPNRVFEPRGDSNDTIMTRQVGRGSRTISVRAGPMGRAGRAPKQAVAATDDDHDDDNDTKCEGCGLGDDEPNLVLCDDCPNRPAAGAAFPK